MQLEIQSHSHVGCKNGGYFSGLPMVSRILAVKKYELPPEGSQLGNYFVGMIA